MFGAVQKHGQLGVGVVGDLEVLAVEAGDERRAEERAGELRGDVARDRGPGEPPADRQRQRDGRVEMRAAADSAQNTPTNTPMAHPQVITIQPLAVPLVRASTTLATTPLPKMMSRAVPMNSAR